MKKAVLILLENFPAYGGTEVITMNLANFLVGKGYSVSIVSANGPAPEVLGRLHGQVEVFHLPNLKDFASRQNMCFMAEIMRSKGVKTVVNQTCERKFASMALRLKKHTGCKLVSVLHFDPMAGIIYRSTQKKPLKTFLKKVFARPRRWLLVRRYHNRFRKIYKGSDVFVLLSERFKASFAAITGLRKLDKLRFIPNPVTFDTVVAAGEMDKKKQIVYLGRLQPSQKRVDRILRIWNELYRDYPQWELVIIGDGSHRTDLESLADSLGLERIRFTGAVQNPEQYLRDASVLLMTSDYEGYPLVIPEGMQFGVVPVSYDSFAPVYDIIEDGKDGYIVPAFDAKAFEQKLRVLMGDPSLLNTMSQNALVTSLRFSKERVFAAWTELFSHL